MSKKKAQAIIQLRKEKGDLLSREQLKKVKGVGENTFLLSASFLMIKNADNLLDSTGVHPESYDNVKKLRNFMEF